MNHVTPTLDTPAISPTYLRLMCQTLRNQGVDPDPVLRAAGLEPWHELLKREVPLTLRQTNALIRAALAISRQSALGLQLGMVVQVSAHGAMGYAMVASATLRQALEVLVRYISLRIAAIRFALIETRQGATFELIERIDLEDGHEFVTSLIFAALVLFIESVAGSRAQGIAVELPFDEPSWRTGIDAMFHGPIRFGSRHLTFHLSDEVLNRPCLTADPSAYAQATMECDRQMSANLDASHASMAQRVRELLMGRESDYPTVTEAARYFSKSPRTLMRKLDKEGTSYQSLLDAARSDRARRYLLETSLTVEEIAARLGYQNTSNFSKTFRRWFNATPSQFRSGSQ